MCFDSLYKADYYRTKKKEKVLIHHKRSIGLCVLTFIFKTNYPLIPSALHVHELYSVGGGVLVVLPLVAHSLKFNEAHSKICVLQLVAATELGRLG